MVRSSSQTDEYPRNTDRAQWAASAMAKFAAVTGLGEDLKTDPQTVLADLLADLMHSVRRAGSGAKRHRNRRLPVCTREGSRTLSEGVGQRNLPKAGRSSLTMMLRI